jgi:hypothetical protein
MSKTVINASSNLWFLVCRAAHETPPCIQLYKSQTPRPSDNVDVPPEISHKHQNSIHPTKENARLNNHALGVNANFVHGLGILATRHDTHLFASGSTSVKSYSINNCATTTFMNAVA